MYYYNTFVQLQRILHFFYTDHAAASTQLFHGTKTSNVFGLLSRGFLLPKVGELLLSNKYDVNRTHQYGNLGAGVYFGDQIETALKYTDRYVPLFFFVFHEGINGNNNNNNMPGILLG